MVAAGLVGAISLVVINITKQSAQTTKTLETNSEMVTVLNEMRALLSDPNQCRKTLTGLNASNTVNAVDSLIYTNKAGVDIQKFETLAANPAAKYGQGNIKIQNYSLSDAQTAVSVAGEETTNLVVQFDRGRGVQGNQLINKHIKLWVDVDGAGLINDCRSLSATSNLIWSRSNINQNDVFYSGGQVGINTSDPTDGFHLDVDGNSRVGANLEVVGSLTIGKNIVAGAPLLDIEGEVKLGDTGMVCDASKEGTMRYNSTLNRMEFCNGATWRRVGGELQIDNCTTSAWVIESATNLVECAPGKIATGAGLRVNGSDEYIRVRCCDINLVD